VGGWHTGTDPKSIESAKGDDVKYTYYIYRLPGVDVIAAQLQTNEPLPHLEIDHELILTTDSFSNKSGTVLTIEDIRVVTSYTKGEFIRYDVHVICREETSSLPL
jgi:hypothetical protein